MIVRLLAGVLALSAGAAAIAVVAALLHHTPGPIATRTASVASPPREPAAAPGGARRFPAPPRSAVVFAHQDRGTVLALAVTSAGGRLGLELSVLGPSGSGTGGLGVAFTVAGAKAPGVPCGAGCYRASVAAPPHRSAVGVVVRGGALDTFWSQPLPASWPAPSASGIVARAGRVWRSLRSLAYVEHLASDPQHAVTSVWRIAAPDRVAYQVVGGYAGIVIGGRRWDRAPGGRWIESVQSAPLTQPVPSWASVSNAHLLGSGTVRGRPVSIVSFYDATIPGWFRAAIDKTTARTLNVEMMATAHFMHDAYGEFNRASPITPP